MFRKILCFIGFHKYIPAGGYICPGEWVSDDQCKYCGISKVEYYD